MAEELKHLLDTIQKDGVAKAEARAEEIVAEGRQRARGIVEEAREKAQRSEEEAEKRAKEYGERGKKALQQAARDTLIALGRAMEHLVERLVRRQTDQAMDVETLKAIMLRLAEEYAKSNFSGGGAKVELAEEDIQALQGFLADRLHEALGEGVEVRTAPSGARGFRISFRDEQLYHDFTSEAVAEELCRFLRPGLREVVRQAAKEQESE